MYLWEPIPVKCPCCGEIFYFPCDPDEFYRHESQPKNKPFVGDDDHAPPDVDRGGNIINELRQAHPEVHEEGGE